MLQCEKREQSKREVKSGLRVSQCLTTNTCPQHSRNNTKNNREDKSYVIVTEKARATSIGSVKLQKMALSDTLVRIFKEHKETMAQVINKAQERSQIKNFTSKNEVYNK